MTIISAQQPPRAASPFTVFEELGNVIESHNLSITKMNKEAPYLHLFEGASDAPETRSAEQLVARDTRSGQRKPAGGARKQRGRAFQRPGVDLAAALYTRAVYCSFGLDDQRELQSQWQEY